MHIKFGTGHGNTHGSKEILVKDLKRVVEDADDLLKEVVSSSAEEFASARERIEAKLGEARSRLLDSRITAGRKAACAADATQAYVRDNPWQVLGVAAAVAGLVTALIFSRR